MFTDLTFLYTSSTGTALRCAEICASEARHQEFSTRILNISAFSPAELLAGGNFLFFLGSPDGNGAEADAIPFWLHLNSLNPGTLKNFYFAIHALGDNDEEQFCAFGNACNVKLSQLGGFRLHPMLASDLHESPALLEWLQGALAKLTPSRSSRWEALAA